MRNLWSGAAAALVLGALAGCASPVYPIEEGQAPARMTQPRPQYAIDEAPASQAQPAAAPPAAAPSDPAPLSAPTAAVRSESLPPPSADASPSTPSGGALQHASLTTEADPAPPAPSSLPPAAPAPAPVVTSTDPAPAPEPSMTPQTVIHDGPPPASSPAAAPAPIHEAYNSAPMHSGGGYSVDGRVVDGSGDIFENYEVQRGDHIDALARAFNTTRTILLDANSIRSPYVIKPGQIIKVPVAKAYVTQSGDTLVGIARRFSVGIGELAEINHVSERAPLRPGMQIGLPSSMRDRGPLPESQYAEIPPSGGNSYHTQPYVPGPPQQAHVSQVTPAEPSLTPDHGTTSYAGTPPAGATAQASFGMTDAQISQAAHGRFVWPVRGDVLSRFGPQGVGRRNDGLDIKAPSGTSVRAAAAGEVVYAGDQVPGFGNLVLIKHADGWVTAYAHLDQVNVQMKQTVTQGQAVGSVGTSGGASEPELHFEVRYAPSPADKAKPVDPVLVLPQS
jgi:murein DD-endopeptidase MepM/ murein hydrolase activator NlpD